MKAMIFAAGMGTRLGEITSEIPKALVEVNGVSVLENAVSFISSHGFNEIIVNVHHHSGQIIKFLNSRNNFGLDIVISDESDRLLDTGGGLKKASWFLEGGEAFLVYNVDVLTDLNLRGLYRAHKSSDAMATMAVRHRETARYLITDRENRIIGWRNIKTEEEILSRPDAVESGMVAYSGIQIIEPAVLGLLPEEDVFSIIPAYIDISRKNCIKTFEHDDSRWLDIGKPDSLGQAKDLFPELGK